MKIRKYVKLNNKLYFHTHTMLKSACGTNVSFMLRVNECFFWKGVLVGWWGVAAHSDSSVYECKELQSERAKVVLRVKVRQ